MVSNKSICRGGSRTALERLITAPMEVPDNFGGGLGGKFIVTPHQGDNAEDESLAATQCCRRNIDRPVCTSVVFDPVGLRRGAPGAVSVGEWADRYPALDLGSNLFLGCDYLHCFYCNQKLSAA
jgi:hypothetical protein